MRNFLHIKKLKKWVFWLRASIEIRVWNIFLCLSQDKYFKYDPFPCNESLQSAHHCPHPVNVSHNFFLTSDLKVSVHALATFLIDEYKIELTGQGTTLLIMEFDFSRRWGVENPPLYLCIPPFMCFSCSHFSFAAFISRWVPFRPLHTNSSAHKPSIHPSILPLLSLPRSPRPKIHYGRHLL